MEQIPSKIKDLEDRISQLEDTKILKHANEKHKHPTDNTQEKVVKDNGKPDQQDEDVTFSNHAQKISVCDYLILSDSILRRSIPKNCSPNGKTIKRFIHGGANICSNFILKNGEHINPKNVLIHIGTRDLQSHGVVSDEEFKNLFEASENMWPNAKNCILPIIRRKDMSNKIMDAANEIIISECVKFEAITLTKKFVPSEDMFFDNVHPNNKRGLPEIVKHLKTALNMYPGNRYQHQKPIHRFHGNDDSFPTQTVPPQNKYGFNAMNISNFQMDMQFPIPPGNAACPPWFPPPTHMPPWQPPFMWGPFRQYNPIPSNFVTNSCN